MNTWPDAVWVVGKSIPEGIERVRRSFALNFFLYNKQYKNRIISDYQISRIISGITDQSIENRNILTIFTSSLSSSSSFDSTNSINPSSRVPLLRLQNDIKHLINAIMYILHYKQSLFSTYFNVHSISKMEV